MIDGQESEEGEALGSASGMESGPGGRRGRRELSED